MQNKYGVQFPNHEEKGFAFHWLGAKVTFKLLGQTVTGTVLAVDGIYKTIDVEIRDGRKYVTVNGHFACFKRTT